VSRPVAPPSGHPPPRDARLGGGTVDPERLAARICERYSALYPDERERYGAAGDAWCRHDNQHILSWAIAAGSGLVDFSREIGWLARVLAARDFPLDRLAHDLELAAEELEADQGADAAEAAAVLRRGAAQVRAA
jgi:hypothetical protein